MSWYDLGKTLSYNCLFNFVIGARGCGKTYALKKRAIKLYKEKGYEFVYLRRYKKELDETSDNYFNDIVLNNEFPDTKISYKNGRYYINDEVFGYAMCLTNSKDYKSISYPKVMLIIFDEFLLEETGYNHYLKNEVTNFLNFYMSIDRYRGCQVFFLGNSITLINPYTVYWNLTSNNKEFTKRGDVLLHIIKDTEFENERKNTRFGKLIANTEFEQFAISNKFLDDNKDFIRKKSEKASYYFTIIYKNDSYGIWIDYKQGEMYVSNDIDAYCKISYSITVADHKPNTLLLTNINKSPFFKNFILAFKQGNLYFESLKLKSIVYEIIKMCMR